MKPGDRVRVKKPGSRLHGRFGRVLSIDELDDPPVAVELVDQASKGYGGERRVYSFELDELVPVLS